VSSGETAESVCRRCGKGLEPGDPFSGFCGQDHRLEARRQLAALVDAGPGCHRCYRGAVFFVWRAEAGRERSAAPGLEQARAAVCWCPAGQRLRLEGGHKVWGYMRDFGLGGEREIAPRTVPLKRCHHRDDGLS